MTTSRRETLSDRAQRVWDRLVWGWGDLRRWLIERGAWPARRVSAVSGDGRRWRIAGTRVDSMAGAGSGSVALLVPEPECLWGTLQLPALPRRALDAAVQEAMWRVSPLPTDTVVTAWCAEPTEGQGWTVDWGLCPRAAVDAAVARQSLADDAVVYLARADGRAFAVRGLAWDAWSRSERRLDALGVIALLAVLAGLLLPALMPLALKHQALERATRHVTTIEPMAAPLRQKLDELRSQAAVVDELGQDIGRSLPLASVLDRLAQALPDDTWLDRCEASDDLIRITGLTGNAADLIAGLGRQPDFADVRTTSATVRDERQGKERFAVELRWRSGAARS